MRSSFASCLQVGRALARSTIKAGQPLYETRPHLVPKGDITPGITALEYYARRQRIFDELPDKSMLLVPGNVTLFATNSVFHPFRQDPNFFYLTGFVEPDACLAMYKENSTSHRTIMFVPENDKQIELWEGERCGTKGAVDIFNADEAYSIEELGPQLDKLFNVTDRLYYDAGADHVHRKPKFFSNLDFFRKGSIKQLGSATALIEQYRLVKSEAEIDVMRAAAEASSESYNIAFSRPFSTESELHAFLDYQFRVHGCSDPAYLAVVAGGDHALTIHYVRNDDVLRDGELVLVDAGGRMGGYCADISRTWPVNGKFTQPQKDLYQAVLNVEKSCIDMCVSSQGYSMSDLHRHSENMLHSELKNAGLDIPKHRIREVYPHSIGHNLGIDVHDIKTASSLDALKSNQVITIEPGVYVPRSDKFPKHFQGIGIRIEDNVVVGDQFPEVLTIDALKEIADLEQARL